MIKIAITGAIASGKSLVEDFFKQKGFNTLDTDKVVHNLLKNNPEVINKVKELFKPADITDKSGLIDRKKVGNIVFNDKQKLKQLEAVIHPQVRKVVEKFFKDNENEKLTAVSVPLLYEAGMETMFDFVILLVADEKIRLQRLINKRNLTEKAAIDRIKSQNFDQEKLEKADFIIKNDDSANNLLIFIEKLLNKIIINY